MVTTVTINQWRIKSNAEKGLTDPVICVNNYEWVTHDENGREFGPKVGETIHYHHFVFPEDCYLEVIYDPINKTPCGASCWVQFET